MDTIRKAEEKECASGKKHARQYLRSAFKTYVRWEYGSYNVAKAFLKHPAADLKRIVRALAEYKRSENYAQRVAE